MDNVKLHRYQEEAVRFMVTRPAAGLFLDPGLGKTLCTYSAFHVLRKAKKVKTMLVVAPLRPLYQTWPQENEKWGFGFEVALLHGKKKVQALRTPADVYLINYEGLEWLARMMQELNLSFDMVVFDESSKLRNTQTKRFKLLRAILKWFKRRYILTGTPAPNGLENLFGQIYTLDAGEALGRYVTHFRTQYFTQDPFVKFPRYNLNAGAAEEIYERIAPLVVRFDDSQLDMPKRIDRTLFVDLPKEARTIYDDLESTLIAQLDGSEVVVAKNAAVATHKLRQVANGGLYRQGETGGWARMHDEKTEAVKELVEELEGQPALIAYEFHHDLARLQEAFPGAPHIGGGVSPKKALEIQAAWDRGELPVVLGQPSSMAHGLNFQKGGRAVIWHSLIYNYEEYDQFNRRIYRQGQTRRVFVYHVVARGTVDELILDVVIPRKGGTQGDLFRALKTYMKQRRAA